MNARAIMDLLRALTRHPFFLMIAGIVLMGVVVAAIAAGGTAMGLTKDSDPVLRLVLKFISALLFLGAYALLVRNVEQQTPTDVALAGAGRELAFGIALGAGAIAVTIGIIALFGGYQVTGTNPASVLVPAAGMAIISGVSEEIIIRGIIFRHLEAWLGSWAALALSAALFGFGHIANPNATLLAAIAIALEAGILLAAIYMLTRRLWAAIGLHAAWNFTQGGVFGVAVSGGEFEGLLRNQISGPELLTGGAFGAEASIPAIIVCTTMGLICLWMAHKRGRFVAPSWHRFRTGQPAPA